MTSRLPVFSFVLPLVFIAVGGGLFLYVTAGHLEVLLPWPWKTTAGRVVESSLERDSSRREFAYEVRVKYEYTVDGQVFTGQKIHPTYGSGRDNGQQKELHRRLAVQTPVKVYYRQGWPSRAYLAVGFINSGFGLVFFSLGFIGAGLGFGGLMWLINYGNHDYASLIEEDAE